MDDQTKEFIEICKRCDLFFKEALDNALTNQHAQISQEAAFYLLGILIMGMRKDTNADTEALTEKYLASYHSKEANAFRAVGDSSLIIAGIWWQSLARRLVDIDFYIKLGRLSYQREAERQKSLPELFEELSENFERSVNILMEATRCISEANMTNQDLLKIYEAWLQTHNTFLEEKLRSYGINPVNIKAPKQ